MEVLNFVYAKDDPVKLIFKQGEFVEFAIESVRTNSDGFTVKARICSGEYVGNFTVLPFKFRTAKGGRAWSTKQFLTLFYQPDELNQGMAVERMIGTRIGAISKVAVVGLATYQDWISYVRIW